MIIFFANGRLGNQIFQYAFLATIAKRNEKIIVFGFDELCEVFDNVKVYNITSKNRLVYRILRKFFYTVLPPILNTLSFIRLITSIKVLHRIILDKYRLENKGYKENKGVFCRFKYVQTGYFQEEGFFNKKAISDLRIKKIYLEQAKTFIGFENKKYTKVVVHIRLGDYKDFSILGKSSILPMSYFHKQIKWFLQNRKNPYFIFLSDEPEAIKKEFDYIAKKSMPLDHHYGVDFAIMTLCQNAILSPSSFGWWGSYMMKQRDRVFAPKYWLGFNSGIQFAGNNTFMDFVLIENKI